MVFRVVIHEMPFRVVIYILIYIDTYIHTDGPWMNKIPLEVSGVSWEKDEGPGLGSCLILLMDL